MDAPRRFTLHRDRDLSGVSGTGVVADGVAWPDGSAVVRWRGEHPSVVVWPDMASVELVHGHDGATRIVWLDDDSRVDLLAIQQRMARVKATTRVYGPDGNPYLAAVEASQADVYVLFTEIEWLRGATDEVRMT